MNHLQQHYVKLTQKNLNTILEYRLLRTLAFNINELAMTYRLKQKHFEAIILAESSTDYLRQLIAKENQVVDELEKKCGSDTMRLRSFKHAHTALINHSILGLRRKILVLEKPRAYADAIVVLAKASILTPTHFKFIIDCTKPIATAIALVDLTTLLGKITQRERDLIIKCKEPSYLTQSLQLILQHNIDYDELINFLIASNNIYQFCKIHPFWKLLANHQLLNLKNIRDFLKYSTILSPLKMKYEIFNNLPPCSIDQTFLAEMINIFSKALSVNKAVAEMQNYVNDLIAQSSLPLSAPQTRGDLDNSQAYSSTLAAETLTLEPVNAQEFGLFSFDELNYPALILDPAPLDAISGTHARAVTTFDNLLKAEKFDTYLATMGFWNPVNNTAWNCMGMQETPGRDQEDMLEPPYKRANFGK